MTTETSKAPWQEKFEDVRKHKLYIDDVEEAMLLARKHIRVLESELASLRAQPAPPKVDREKVREHIKNIALSNDHADRAEIGVALLNYVCGPAPAPKPEPATVTTEEFAKWLDVKFPVAYECLKSENITYVDTQNGYLWSLDAIKRRWPDFKPEVRP